MFLRSRLLERFPRPRRSFERMTGKLEVGSPRLDSGLSVPYGLEGSGLEQKSSKIVL